MARSGRFRFAAAAHLLEDDDPKTGKVIWHRGRKGQRLDSPIRGQKIREATRRVPWARALVRRLKWRPPPTATVADRLVGCAQTLVRDPHAWNEEKS